MKRKISLSLALVLMFSLLFSLSGITSAAGSNYITVNGVPYTTDEQIASVFAANSGVIQDNAIIRVFGQVDIPMQRGSYTTPKFTVGPNIPFFWILLNKNVQIIGDGDDAALYSSTVYSSGSAGGQSFIYVLGENCSFNNVTLQAPRNNYYAADGYVNKTLEVYSKDFTATGCTFTSNTSGDGTATGGTLYFNGAKGVVRVEGNLLEKCAIRFDSMDSSTSVQIKNNEFVGTRDSVNTPLISNTTWATPPVIEMGDVQIESNNFSEIPADWKYVVVNSMQGKMYLVDNTMDIDGDGTPDQGIVNNIQIMPVDRFNTKDDLKDGAANLLVTENGVNYSVTTNETGTQNPPKKMLSGVTISNDKLTLNRGVTFKLSAAPNPLDASDATAISWKSSDDKVAVVDANGIVVATGQGTATITATCGDYSAACKVTVNVTYTQWLYDVIQGFFTRILQIALDFFNFKF